jgi:hypothetical protein
VLVWDADLGRPVRRRVVLLRDEGARRGVVSVALALGPPSSGGGGIAGARVSWSESVEDT